MHPSEDSTRAPRLWCELPVLLQTPAYKLLRKFNTFFFHYLFDEFHFGERLISPSPIEKKCHVDHIFAEIVVNIILL